jgi:putative RecB family exonuclease
MNYISASQINLYSDCSLKYKFRYIDKIPKPSSSIHLVFGSAIHKALEELNKSLASKKIGLEDVYQYFHNDWEKEKEKQEIRENFISEKLYTMGLNSLEKYYNEHLDYEIIGSETKFNVPIIYPDGEKEKFTLFGIIDSIITKKNKLIIVDYKTSKEPYEKFKIDTSIQLAMYSYAFRHLLKENIIELKKKKEDYISYCVILKDYETLNGEIKIQRKKIDDFQINKMLNMIKQTKRGIDSELFLPNYQSMCKWCEFKKECLNYDL